MITKLYKFLTKNIKFFILLMLFLICFIDLPYYIDAPGGLLNVNDKKLTRALVETMAGEWQRKGIETVEDAMSLCEKEHKKRNKKVIEEKKVNVKTPDWFDKEIEKNKINDGEDNQLEELLKEYK